MDGWTDWLTVLMDGQMDGLMDGWTDGWMDRWMGRWIDEQMIDGWTEKGRL